MSKFGLKRAKSRVLGTGLGAAFLLASAPAISATILVNSTTDALVDGTNCTLRGAVMAANSNTAVGGCTAGDAAPTVDVINFAGSVTYPISQGELAITEAVSFNEGGQTPSINANGTSRIFNNSADLTITDMVLTGGSVSGAATPAENSGGAILNNAGGTLTVIGGAMNNNTATRAGGAIEDFMSNAANAITLTNVDFTGNNAGGMMPAPGNGGVVHVTGSAGVSITGGTQTENVAANEGGALWNGSGLMTVDGTEITNNDANGADQSEGGGGIFNEGGTLTITGATITGNNATGSAATPAAMGSGGGILNNSGTLTVTDSTISGNSAVRAGGGIESDARELGMTALTTLNNVTMDSNTTGPSPGNGGALHVSGGGNTTQVNGGTFSNNIAANEGGGLWNFGAGATMTIDGATISLNQGNGTGAANGGGGLFNNGGIMNVLNSTIDNNTAVASNTDGSAGSGSGGGILNAGGGTLTVTGSTISSNRANRAGGGIETGSPGTTGSSVTLDDVVLTTNTVNTSPGNGGGLHAGGDASVDVTNSIVINNNAGLEGGGLWVMNGPLNISGTRISGNNGLGDRATNANSGNADGGGGGIVVNGTGTLTITANSLIAQNIASGNAGSGGGIFIKPGSTANITDSVIAANSASRAGGGIENDGGTVNLLRVTLGGADSSSGNMGGTSPGNGGGLHTTGAGTVTIDDSVVSFNTSAEGGGLWNSGAGTLTVNNTTISNNQATASTGGGVHQDGDGGDTELNFVTVTQNTAAGNGGGFAAPGASDAAADSSIIAGNTSGAADSNTSGGVVVTNSVVDTNAGLGNLQLFGGVTATHPILTGSPALDSGDATACALPPISSADQRGATRPAACDAGAFEAAGNPVVTVTNNSQGSVTVPADGASDVTVLAFTLANNSGGQVTIDGVSGVVDAAVAGLDPSNFQVFANGSSTPIAGAEVAVDGRSFTVTFNGATGVVFDDGDSVPYTVTADFGMATTTTTAVASIGTPVFAGGLLLSLLGLFSVGGIRRRTQWGLLVIAMAVGLSACGSSGSGGGIFDFGDNDNLAPADLRFIAITVDGDAGTGDFIVGNGMPVAGPGINF